jgi:citrate lyase beta subunit
MTQRIRRALLFMPGDDRRKIEKGASLDVDCIIMDLEDGVALNNKDAARSTIRAALKEVDFGKKERLVRINAVTDDSPLWKTDIDGVIDGKPDGLVIPKVESPSQVNAVADYLTVIERDHGWDEGSVILIAIVETALGIVNLKEIASQSQRLVALAFGAEDLAGSMGATRTPDGWEGFYGRSAVVVHAKAFGLQAIDTPFVDLVADSSQLIAETEQAHYLGYDGKLAIHPRHIEPIQSVFTPSDDAIRRAKRLVEAHNAHQAENMGVFALDGKMVDMPMVRAAETILARAKAAGKHITE